MQPESVQTAERAGAESGAVEQQEGSGVNHERLLQFDLLDLQSNEISDAVLRPDQKQKTKKANIISKPEEGSETEPVTGEGEASAGVSSPVLRRTAHRAPAVQAGRGNRNTTEQKPGEAETEFVTIKLELTREKSVITSLLYLYFCLFPISSEQVYGVNID